ncbi:MAG: DUF3795 domain-containing protein [Bacteroidales bacterium]|nr:DUF3795 domain-containing protein [Bacteroidales bacterium]
MSKLISCCGLNCETCDAYIATINDSDELRATTAEKWKKMFNAPALDPKTINCLGCRQEGVKFAHCYECKIRNCAMGKGFETCGDCPDLETCEIVSQVHQVAPEALENLKKLN